jgi:hypothetical protein
MLKLCTGSLATRGYQTVDGLSKDGFNKMVSKVMNLKALSMAFRHIGVAGCGQPLRRRIG